MRKILYLFPLLLLSSFVFSQNTQTIRGQIADKENKMALPAVVTLYRDSGLVTGASADVNGNYKW